MAALLTLLGWGVGLYYARQTRAAISAAIGQLLAMTMIAGVLLAVLARYGPLQLPPTYPSGLSVMDTISWSLTIVVAIIVWWFVCRHELVVRRAGPVRLFGYAGMVLLPTLIALLLALMIRTFFLQPFQIPAGSMRPTLQAGDYFAVSKWDIIPARGDVVVFANKKDNNRSYVKRVIGLSGDQIQMRGGVLHINGSPVEKDFVEISPADCGGGADALVYRETLNTGASYIVQECAGDRGSLDNVGPYQVPEGHFFMMGDNRDQSQDSRIISAVGYIPHDSLVGKVLMRQDSAD